MREFKLVSIDEIHHRVAPLVERQLIPMGFELQKPLHWVRSDDAPIRQVFAFVQYKGGALAPFWGLSLDFVPHVSGAQVKWHRTVKSARFDLNRDARDRNMELSYIWGPEELARNAPVAISNALLEAEIFWKAAKSIPELPAAFMSTKQYMSGGGLGFYNYVQHPLAFAFVLAKLGQPELANAEFDRYLQSDMNSAVVDRLREMLSHCTVAKSFSEGSA